MQSNNRSISVVVENGVDMCLNIASLAMAYIFAALFRVPETVSFDSPRTMLIVFCVVLLQSFVFQGLNLYRSVPFVNPSYILGKITRANIIYYLIVEGLCLLLFDESREFMLVWMLISAVISTAVLLFKKRMMIRFVALFRRKQYSLRRVILVGDNTATAAEFVRQVAGNAECGMMIIGYVGDKINPDVGCDKLGSFKELASILDEHHPTDVVFAIDGYDKRHLIRLVNICDDRCIKVYFLPVIYGFFKSARQIEPVGTLPVINIHSTPLDNRFNAFLKRVIDVVGSAALILLTLPIMLVAAIGVVISSPGPVFFAQERIGKMGRPFKMLKFRSMRVNVDSDKGWTTGDDPRKTRFGTFIRRMSIDELPQLFNVFLGTMSLVGPRPEVPHFVEYFKERIPLYMVKHYVKPGMTGLAQIRGLRGDTSVEDRIHADIEYIENWTLGMDIAILLKTPFKAINKQERYVGEPEDVTAEEDVTPTLAESDESREGAVADGAEAPMAAAISEAEIASSSATGEGSSRVRGKILYAASTMSHINNFHLDYIAALREEGYEVRIMARGDGADYNLPFEKKFLSSANTACRAEIRRILKEERFDIIFLNTSLAAFHIRMSLPRGERPRVVNMVHGYLFSKDIGLIKRTVLLLSEWLLRKKTDKIIVMNEWDRAVAEKYHLAREGVIFCRGMGATVRPAVTSPDRLRREYNCQDRFVMTFVGDMSKRKNQEFLIYALNEIKEFIPNAVLWLVGDGIDADKLHRTAEEVDLSESVFFMGRQENACDYMRAADLYVSASSIEGMPFNLIEAMGCGRTVLASAVKGHTDLISDGVSGFLYRFGSMRDFVEKVKLIHSGELSLRAEDITARYLDFAKETVFTDTLQAIKESFK